MRRMTQTLASLWWTSLLLIGLPAALIRLVGWPLPAHAPTREEWVAWAQQPLTRATILGSAAILAWAMWAALLATILASAYARIARLRRHLPDIRLPGPLQGLSAAMLGTLAVSTSVGGAASTPVAHAAATADAPHPARPDLTADRHPTEPMPPRRSAARADPPADQPSHTVTVQRGDTLWDIAGAWLGDHSRWPEIYRLNADRYDQHGRMKHGDHIEPGWVLVLPDDAAPPTGAAPTPPDPPAGQQPPPVAPPSATPTPPAAGPSSPAPSAPGTAAPAPSQPATATSAPDDGVVPPVPTPTGTGSAAASPSQAAHAAPSPRSPHANPPGIWLPGGGWVDLGLAAAIVAAAALVWIQRRRRYVPRPPSPVLRMDDPDLAPMPPVVRQIRCAIRDTTPDAGLSIMDNDDEAVPMDEQDPTCDPQPPPEPEPMPAPVAPALDHPLLWVWPPAGLGLTGPGGEAAARGFLVAALSAGGLDEPEARGRVVIPAATLATLLGTEAVGVGDTPRLTVTAGLPEALEVLEEATLHRTRLVYDHGVDTVAALREADPLEEPLPPVLLIADATTVHERARIAALLTQGQRLDIHGVLLGVWADGNTVRVGADGATAPGDCDAPRHGGHPADVGRLTVLDPTESADLLRTLAEAHTGQRQPAPPVEHAPAAHRPGAGVGARNDEKATSARPGGAGDGPHPDSATDGGEVHEPVESAGQDGVAAGADANPPTGVPPTNAMPAPQLAVRPAARPDVDHAGPATDDSAAAGEEGDQEDTGGDADRPPGGQRGDAATPAPGRVRVFLLGAPRIADLPPPTRGDPPLRPQALELLVYLATHGGAAGKDQILEDVLGNAPQRTAPDRLNTYLYSLRRKLKHAFGEATYVAPPEQGYALNRDALDIDLWRMQDAITEADTATDPATRIAALHRAVACYTGPLAAGRDYEWLEPYRQGIRQQAIDAHLALVAALSDAHPDQAVRVLHAAIDHDPYTEPRYEQAMRLHARLGDVEAIRGLRRTLTRRMGDIDAEPSDDIIALADQLITDLQHRPRRPRPLRGDAA